MFWAPWLPSLWKSSTVLGDLCCETPKRTSRGLEDERLIKIRFCCAELCPENPCADVTISAANPVSRKTVCVCVCVCVCVSHMWEADAYSLLVGAVEHFEAWLCG